MAVEKGITEISTPDKSPGWKFWKRRRYVVAFMAFLGFFNVYALRANLSIAIVVMTENKPVTIGNDTVYMREFDWDSRLQGYVLSSFFYGYITTQLLGGWLATIVGGQRLFGVGVGATAFLTLVSPIVAKTSVYLFIALRVVEGIFEGVTYPCIHAVWSQWAPPLERSRLATFAFTGSYLGTVVSMPVCALLSQWLGWPSIFYVFGVVGLIWFAMWNILLSERPTKDPKISPEELKYITESLGTVEKKKVIHPWKSILTSVPVWAIIAANFSENWGFYTFLTQLPKYMKDILKFDITHTGFMTALPYLVMSIMLLLSGHIADWFLVKKILTVSQVRKLFNCGAFISQSVFLIGASFATTATMGMICLIFAAGLGSFSLAGFSVNYLDIAPQHASVLMGIGNTIGSIPGIVSPILSGYVVTTPTRGEWQVVFFISAGIYLTGCIIYGFFATGELQPWAIPKETEKPKPEEKTEKYTNGYDNNAFQANS